LYEIMLELLMMDNMVVENEMIRFVSYNGRGFNVDKQKYVQKMLRDCDIMLLQEHWLSDSQLSVLDTLSPDHASVAVSGFGNNSVLTGRPYGDCAILWRKNISFTASPITSNSRRIYAVLFCGAGVRFVCLCIHVYMPYESDFSSTEEFQFQLSAVDTIISQHQDAHIILGGDFNVAFSRNWTNTKILDDYCEQAGLYLVFRHSNSTIDYTHHFNMKHFSRLDHFVVSERLYQASVCKQFVIHDVDNTSDHDPLCLHLALRVEQMKL